MGHLRFTGLPEPDGATAAGSVIGRLDPRLRIVATLCFAVTVVGLSSLVALCLACAVSLAFLFLSRQPPWRTLRRVAMMDGFILFMLVLLPFTVPGEPAFELWGLTASREGVFRAVEIALTANAVILALMTLVGSMAPATLGHALHALRCPTTLIHLLMFTIRYIHVLQGEYLRLREAMKVRGFRPASNWHSYRSLGYLVGMMLVRAIDRAERILEAMKCRGFSGRLLLPHPFHLTAADAAFAVGLLAVCGGLLGFDYVWH